MLVLVQDHGRVDTSCLNGRSISHTACSRALSCKCTESALVLKSDAVREVGAELEVAGVFVEVICADRTLDVECLRRIRVVQQFVLLEGVANQTSLVEIHTIFAVGALAPSAAIEHASCILRALVTVKASMLGTIE